MSNIQYSRPINFDAAAKMAFAENSFRKIKAQLKNNIVELSQIVNIKATVLIDSDHAFEGHIANNNRDNSRAAFRLNLTYEASPIYKCRSLVLKLTYSIAGKKYPSDKIFMVTADEDHIYWTVNYRFGGLQSAIEVNTKTIAETIWNEWLENITLL